MPDMDGFRAVEHIRSDEQESGRRVPIVAITAHALNGWRERCIAAGMDAYLPKPICPQDLLDCVSSILLAEAKTHATTNILEQSIVREMVGSNFELLSEMVNAFQETAPELLEKIKTAIHNRNGIELRNVAHALRGSVGNFGPSPAQVLSEQLEQCGEGANFRRAGELLPELDASVREILAELSRMVATTAAAAAD